MALIFDKSSCIFAVQTEGGGQSCQNCCGTVSWLMQRKRKSWEHLGYLCQMHKRVFSVRRHLVVAGIADKLGQLLVPYLKTLGPLMPSAQESLFSTTRTCCCWFCRRKLFFFWGQLPTLGPLGRRFDCTSVTFWNIIHMVHDFLSSSFFPFLFI